MLAEHLASLSPKQRALLEMRLRQRRGEPAAAAGIPRRGTAEPAPLSFAQRRLWFLDQLEPGSSAYNLPVAVRLGGDLDVRALGAALGEVVRRHETLRTTFVVDATGELAQVVAPPFAPLRIVDLSGLGREEAEAAARRLVEGEAQRPFDLTRGPLFRALLLRLSHRDHLLAASLHHTVGDGWSQGLLLREIGALYMAFASGLPSPLPELPIQYGDYAAWQRQVLSGAALEAELAHWRERLRGMPSRIELPTDRPRPAVRSHPTGSRPFALGEEATEALRALAAHGGATLFMVLLAGFEALLAQASAQEDFGVGTPVAGRGRAETEGLIGFFANTLVLRADVAGDPSPAGLIERVRTATLDAYAHQEIPFEKLVEELEPERSLAHTPLFQTMLVLHNAPTLGEEAFAVPGLRLTPLDLHAGQTKFDLHLSAVETGGGLAGSLELDTELFDLVTGDRLLERFRAVLEALALHPETPLSALPRLPEAERHQLLAEWNATGRAYGESNIPDLFLARAAADPERTALVFEGQAMSYGRLARQARGLARRLWDLGVGPEVPVGVALERSLELVTGLLGVLDAGGAYVPLDPELPDQRLAQLLAEIAPPVVLTRTEHHHRFAAFPGTVICLDEAEFDEDPASGRPWAIDGDSLAYVIFTSGSTGTPKGAMNTHAGIANRLLWMQEAYGLGPADRVLQKTPYTFDVSVWELFWPLITGATLVVARPGGHRDPDYLLRTIAEQGITTLHFVPSMLQAFLEEPGMERAVSLVRVFASGEALPGPLAGRFAELLPGVPLHNLYGPTEAAVDVTFHACTSADFAGVVPIGRPIANLEIRIVDRHGAPVPPGAPGELRIGGVGLARGYLGRPELTAERFVPGLEWDQPGGRLYRTGDLARHRPDGVIEFLGRIDHQVKIRGFRVEPGEIEAALGGHPAVREAVVTAHGEGSGRRLVAYVIAAAGAEPEAGALRDFLRERLPAYMVPELWVFLDAFPLTTSGKVDRKALPAPREAGSPGSVPGLAPRDPVEETLAAIWGEVLGLPRIGVHDDFFALGGHSLLATQVRSRLRQLLDVELPLRTLFEAPTLAGLAERVRAGLRGAHRPEVPPLAAAGEAGPAPLSFAQQRLWFLDQLDPGSAAYNLGSAVRLCGELRTGALAASLAEIVRRHGALRTVFSRRGAEPVQEVRPAGGFHLPFVDLSGLDGANAEALRLAGAELRRPFDLARGPLFRALLVRCRADEHVLAIALHHTVGDGWSMEVLEGELAALYAGGTLPELPVQYTDFARWQRSWLAGEALAAEIEHWRLQLAGMPPQLDLPTDRPRPAVQSFAGASRSVALSGDLTAALRDLARREGGTLFMTLLAGLQTVLARLAGQESLGVGTAIAGRNRVELEGLIGFFANTLVLRGNLGGDPSFRGLLGRVRRTTLDAYAHQDVPFEKLVEELAPERSLARTPLFQVMFAFQNAAAVPRRPALPGLALEPLAPGGDTAKFDLTLLLAESAAGIEGKLEYARDLFDAPTVDRLLGHLATLLEAAATAPDRPVHELPLLAAAERAQIVAEWNDTATAFEEDVCLHELFERQAAKTPDALAVVDGREELTYRELGRRADRLARTLAARGVAPGDLVAVCLDRSAAMPAALLGILRTGAAYVPLDAGWPASRAAWILSRLGIRHLVTEEPRLAALASELGSTGVTEVIRLVPSFWETSDPANGRLEESRAEAGDRAYIIFTSGTTGTPKGVVVRHRPVVNLIEWVNRSFAVGPGDRLLFLTSLCFDLSVYDIFGTLAAGSCIRVASDAETRDPRALLDILLSEPITFWDSAPAALQQLAPFLPERPEPGSGHLRLVFLSGDWIPVTLPDRLRRAFPGAQPVALGGATEATVWSNFHDVRAVDPAWPSIPYGRPIQNARYHVLDARLAPCPIRVAGDLYIGGGCLSGGYWGEPELTATKYIPDPFSRTPGDRLYRTGDRARAWPDGTLEFLGRLDHQVKIRGFRVELGEIEAVLGRHPDVREAAVLAVPGADGHRLLVAYAAPRGAARPTAAELREHVARHVPDSMVPSAFVLLDALPVTANGKLDRKALPAPDFTAAAEAAGRPPRTPLEELLAGLWAEVLGVPSVGVDQSFFDLGGHSLLATQLTARLQQTLGIEVPLRRLFEQPTVAGLAESLAAEGPRDGAPAAPPLVPIPRDPAAPPPLSFAQERLWFLDQIQPDDSTYNVAAAVRLRGRLDASALAAALDEIARRHEALRTSFTLVAGSPAQIVAPSLSLAPPLVDLGGLPPAARQEETLRRMREEGGRPFDLAHGPLARTRLLRLDADEHAILLTLHHTIADAWSMGVLVRELAVLYAAFLDGRPAPLPALPVQYADFAVWQRQWLSGAELERQIGYWRERLAGAPARLDLPTDRPRPAVQTARGARLPWQLPSAGLERLARQRGATPFMVLLAAFAAVLARSSGQGTVVVGAPNANRTRVETEGLIGDFANTLALRLDVGDDPSGGDLLARAREATLGAHAHQDLPFEKLVEELRPERSLAHSPIFQVMLNLQNTPARPVELPGLTLEPLAVEGETAKYELTLELTPAVDGLAGVWEHNRDLFDAATVLRMAGHFRNLLEGLAGDPERPVSEIPLLSPEERRELAGWNRTAAAFDLSRPLHAWIAGPPEALAVRFEDETLTYGELHRRTDLLAGLLSDLGVGPGSLIGVSLEPSLETVVAVLGVIKTGAAYLPLDPAYPAERLAFMIADSRIPVLLTQSRIAPSLPPHDARVLFLDAGWGAEMPSRPFAPVATDAEERVYVLYTSGSTGRPKGVEVPHRALMNFLFSMRELLGFGAEDRLLSVTTLSFDIAALELYLPLVAGGSVELAGRDVATDGERLRERLETSGATFLQATPSTWRMLVRSGWEGTPGLAVLCGGEPLPDDLARDLSTRGGAVWNLYGPTETAVWSAADRLPEPPRVTLGRPIANTSIHLLDRHREAVPVGIPGELYIGGDGVTRGYLRRPELTAERFLPDPVAERPGSRLYRTGDLARRLPDGRIEFLGRVDHQVKIRGFRIELGEIEAVLLQHPAVREAVVLARRDQPGEIRLVAYVVGTAVAEDLRAHLRGHLPEYMVPPFFVPLAALPLLPNGKVDRKALPAPEPAPREAYVPPGSALERQLAEIWSEVLRVERVGRSDNFFDLGGHSLLMVELRNRLRERLGRDVAMLDLLRHTTVKALAEHLGGGGAAAPAPPRSQERKEEIDSGKARLRQRLGLRRT